ncbi:MAG: type II secretion system protein [Verrucomicrobiales bacterium]
MKRDRPGRRSRGFTVIEMTLALALGLGVAMTLISLLQQQIGFSKALMRFSFLRDEAPQINTLLSTIITKADNYRIYPDVDKAKAATEAVRSGGRALRLRFRNPDGDFDTGIVAFEVADGEKKLNYYLQPSGTGSWTDAPNWTISSQPDLVDFDNSSGILLITMTGENGDQITYAGSPD